MEYRARAATALLYLLGGFAGLAWTGCAAGGAGYRPAASGPPAPFAVSTPTPSQGTQGAAPAVAPPPPPVSAETRFPVPVVELRGAAADLGAVHGRQLAGSIRLLQEKYLRAFIPNAVERFLALAAAGRYESLLLPEHRTEMKAMAEQSGLGERQAALAQCFLDLMPMTACSTVALPASASPDGVARFGRNLDFASLGVADRYSTVFIYHPRGRYAFASVGWPGMIGVLSGMNEHGLTIANMEVSRGARLPEAMPYTLLYRTVLERCRTTDEAIELLRRTPRQTANNLMIMDAAGERAVAEITPAGVTVRHGRPTAALLSTNHQRGADEDAPGRCGRYDCLHAESKRDFGRIDVALIESMLSDVSPGGPTLQAMVFEPASRVIYLSAGEDAANKPFHRLDLKRYFEGEESLGWFRDWSRN